MSYIIIPRKKKKEAEKVVRSMLFISKEKEPMKEHRLATSGKSYRLIDSKRVK